jgi:hypothetical protein
LLIVNVERRRRRSVPYDRIDDGHEPSRDEHHLEVQGARDLAYRFKPDVGGRLGARECSLTDP